MSTRIFVNRTLNMKKITHIGLDMDLTLVRYKSENFESLTHKEVLRKLVVHKNYPKAILDLKMEFSRAIRGLVLDKQRGNLLKLSRFGAIRRAYHGLGEIQFDAQNKIYKNLYINISEENYEVVDTYFSLALSVLFSQLVDLKDRVLKGKLPPYKKLADDLIDMLDVSHKDNTIKKEVVKNLESYILRDPKVVEGLERYTLHKKNIFIITNSDPIYTKALLDFAIQPFLKKHKHWLDLFQFVITNAQKPQFFFENKRFSYFNEKTNEVRDLKEQKLIPHRMYVGGSAALLTEQMSLDPKQILYIGDHIYSDVLRIKKDSGWRTALVVEELNSEIEKQKLVKKIREEINSLMAKKIPLEMKMAKLTSKDIETNTSKNKSTVKKIREDINSLDTALKPLLIEEFRTFNPYWGEIFRAGQEETLLNHQIERFACFYTSELKNFLKASPRTYFRAHKRLMPHETL